jgi:hypothetical protein
MHFVEILRVYIFREEQVKRLALTNKRLTVCG